MNELPVAAIDRIIRKGSNMRVSEKAAKSLADFLEDKGIKIAQQAAVLARHASRKTITEADIKLSIRE